MRKVTLIFCLFSVFLFSISSVFAGRYYMPDVARWATPDPALRKLNQEALLRIHNGMLLSTSPYNYTFNNPLRYVDEDGEIPTLVAGAISGALLDIGIQLLENRIQGNKLTDINFKQVAASAGLGAVGGGLISKFGRLKTLLRLGSKADELINVGDDVAQGVANLTDDAIKGTAKFADSKFATHLEKQLAKDGPKSIQKSLRSLKKRLAKHTEKLPKEKFKSSIKREIRTYQKQIDTIKQFLKEKGLE